MPHLRPESPDQILVFLRSAKEEEAARLAEYLHSRVLGVLAAVRMSLGVVTPEESCSLLDSAISAVRCVEGALRPPDLDFGLASAVEYQARLFQQTTGIQCIADVRDEDLPANPASSASLLRILREILTAVELHAAAAEVVITSSLITSTVDGPEHMLQIQDNGRRRTPAGRPPEPLRSWNLELLAAAMGATLSLRGTPGLGATIRLRIPRQGSPAPS